MCRFHAAKGVARAPGGGTRALQETTRRRHGKPAESPRSSSPRDFRRPRRSHGPAITPPNPPHRRDCHLQFFLCSWAYPVPCLGLPPETVQGPTFSPVAARAPSHHSQVLKERGGVFSGFGDSGLRVEIKTWGHPSANRNPAGFVGGVPENSAPQARNGNERGRHLSQAVTARGHDRRCQGLGLATPLEERPFRISLGS